MADEVTMQEKKQKTNLFALMYTGSSLEVRVRTTSVAARKEIASLQQQYNTARTELLNTMRDEINKLEADVTASGKIEGQIVGSNFQIAVDLLDDEYITKYARALVDRNQIANRNSPLVELVDTNWDDDFWQNQDINTLRNMYLFFREAA